MARWPLSGYWLTLALVLLTALTGCGVPSTAPRDLARAQRADSLGHDWTATRLYRLAARGGSLEAQIHLAGDRYGLGGRSWATRLLSPSPTAAESAMWARTARTTAGRLAAAGDPVGHEALGAFAYYGTDLSMYSSEKASAEDYAEAKHHFETAIALGSTRATQSLAHIVWFQDGLLAAEPFFRASYAAGNHDAAQMLAMIALERPALLRGRRGRDAPGDLSLLDIVGSIRVLHDAGDAQNAQAAAERIGQIRVQARNGDVQADSLLRAIGAVGLLG